MEETRLAMLSIIVEDKDQVEKVNMLLHEYGPYILGRMGLPYKERGISLISVAIDAPQDAISSLSGKIGRLNGVTAKALYAKI